jgi:glycosyltransferase involved in cell wall biosynthesis
MSELRIAYFINQYPKVSHSFIRREILALERQGFEVLRMALRGWDSELVDDEDLQERSRTRYVLGSGITGLLLAVASVAISRPLVFMRSFWLALKLGIRADRPWPYHLVYLAEACRILPWMKQFGARHVHAHFGTNSAEVVMLARALGGPAYSFTVHGPEEFDKAESLKIRDKVRQAAFVVAISSFGRSQLYRWVDYADWSKIKIVHCGLERAFYQVPATPMPLAARLVCVGRLCEQKGQLLLVNAVSMLARSGIELELVLAGDGEMRAEITQLIGQLGIQDRVRITGWVSSDQVKEEILASRALVLPSFAEGLPVVIMEAMALRRPVISTYVAGIPELVRPGEDGWLCPAGDVEALVATLKDFLAMPFNMLQEMGDAAHARVIERHSIDVEARKLAQLFLLSTESQAYAAKRVSKFV